MYASAEYHCSRTSSYWETDQNEINNKIKGLWNIGHKRPSFELELEIIKKNFLSKICDYYFKNMTSRVLTRFSFDLDWWPSFLPQVTHFQT